ncbi:hypothetical protein [Bradyrhizobium sp. F1.13.3]|uniref:hypothetical protein n=1 Tax=Bradyrhizobium sp. F1.13.3 TaxID=3156351 RepID=UPI00339719FE
MQPLLAVDSWDEDSDPFVRIGGVLVGEALHFFRIPPAEAALCSLRGSLRISIAISPLHVHVA